MTNDLYNIREEWHRVNRIIRELGEKKSQMSHGEFCVRIADAYARKRIVCARLRSMRPVSKRDLGYQQRLGVNRYEET